MRMAETCANHCWLAVLDTVHLGSPLGLDRKILSRGGFELRWLETESSKSPKLPFIRWDFRYTSKAVLFSLTHPPDQETHLDNHQQFHFKWKEFPEF